MAQIFICFTGTDGSGKSTLAARVYGNMIERRIRTRKTYGRYQPLLIRYVMAIGRRLFLKNKDMFSDYDGYMENKKSVFRRSSLISKLYIDLMLFEYLLEIIFKISIPRRMGYSIVSDRYVYDTIINDIAIDMNLSSNKMDECLERIWTFLPKPDITFLVKVPEEIAMKRKSDIPSISYLKTRNAFYEHLAISDQFVTLDGTISIDELEHKVLGIIEKMIK